MKNEQTAKNGKHNVYDVEETTLCFFMRVLFSWNKRKSEENTQF